MTDADLYDHVQRLFGIGDWHEGHPQPYWQYRALEVRKTKATRAKRRVSAEELWTAADYCKANGIDIRHMAWLYHHITDAKRWAANRQRALATADLDDLIAEAVAIEVAAGSDWVDRLIRASGPHRQEVYDAWLNWRRSSPSDVDPGPASSASTRRQA